MSRNEIILGLVALVLVVFSLVVALVVPQRNPGFPGRSLRPFLVVAVALVIGMLASVEVLGGEHEAVEREGVAADEEAGTAPPQPPGESGETNAGEGEPEGGGGGAQEIGDAGAGEAVFASAGCGSCHTLQAAGSTGQVGPDLDASQPPLELVIERVANGRGVMPAFAGQLSEEEIQNVAAYVVQSTQG